MAKVDPVSEHGEGGGFENEFLTTFFDVLRPAEGSFFEPLGDDPVSGAIEVEDLDEAGGSLACDVC